MTAEAFAPAKVNLTLHVTGRRDDGYHLLDSIVMFAEDVGDCVRVAPAPQTSLRVSGPMSDGVPTDDRNIVVQAANLMGVTAAIELEKHLPNAAGIGGGSSDAGAVLRILRDMSGTSVPDQGLSLGADVPVCLRANASRMQGVGEIVTPLQNMPETHAVLVNPRVAVPTGPVFKNLKTPHNAGMPQTIPTPQNAQHFANWLADMRNDLEAPAISVEPKIATTLEVLRATQDCLLARMSGSGATCFGLFPDAAKAKVAAERIGSDHPDWWVRHTKLS